MIRIVKMHFKTEHVQDFLDHFQKIKTQIRAMPGNEGLTLLQDKDIPEIFFTYSTWQQEADLENYRVSTLFTDTWQLVKTWFAHKAAAWSTDALNTL